MKIFLITLLVIFIFSQKSLVAYADNTDDFYTLYNQVRIEQGLKAVEKSSELELAAQKHADDMVLQNYFSHKGLDQKNHMQRIKETDFKACYTAENIAKGQKDTAQVLREWMNSSGHRKNLLSPKAEYYGLGQAGDIWVMVFARGCK